MTTTLSNVLYKATKNFQQAQSEMTKALASLAQAQDAINCDIHLLKKETPEGAIAAAIMFQSISEIKDQLLAVISSCNKAIRCSI